MFFKIDGILYNSDAIASIDKCEEREIRIVLLTGKERKIKFDTINQTYHAMDKFTTKLNAHTI